MSEQSEVPHVKMQLLKDEDGNILIDFEPPLSEEQKSAIVGAHAFMDIPEGSFKFHDYAPRVGKPFTELSCTTIETAIARDNFELNRLNFASLIGDILTSQGAQVDFDRQEKPVNQAGYWFSGGLTTHRPL